MQPLEQLVACPHCDALHENAVLAEGDAAQCQRCGAVLQRNQGQAVVSVLSLAVTSFLLMLAAISFPFLDLRASGVENGTSLFGAVMAFSDDFAIPLAVAVAAFIIFLPLLRLGALIMAVTPLVAGYEPSRRHKAAFGLAEDLRPWSMAEIFIVGVAVALVKVADLATITFGPAFWAFTILVVLTFFQDTLICRYTIWQALDKQRI
ncbi:MAG: paraquat-inducible protein A [Pseudomonadota bacterium]